MTRHWRTTEEGSECLPYDLLCPGMGEGGTRGRVRLLSPANVTLLSRPETPEKNFHQWPTKTPPAINTCVRTAASHSWQTIVGQQEAEHRSKQAVLGQRELNTGQNRLYWGNGNWTQVKTDCTRPTGNWTQVKTDHIGQQETKHRSKQTIVGQ